MWWVSRYLLAHHWSKQDSRRVIWCHIVREGLTNPITQQTLGPEQQTLVRAADFGEQWLSLAFCERRADPSIGAPLFHVPAA